MEFLCLFLHCRHYLFRAGEPLQDNAEQDGGVLLRLQPPAAEASRELKPEWERGEEKEEGGVNGAKLFWLNSVDAAVTHLLAMRLSGSTLLSLISSPPGQEEVEGH